MKVYGRKVTQEDMDNIASYMDADIREKLHTKLAPCEPEEFIRAYLQEDPEFEGLLRWEFEFEED